MTTEYWQEVQLAEAALPPGDVVYIATTKLPRLQQPEGGVSEATRRNAARFIAEGKARLATPEEINAFRRAQDARTEECRAAEALRKGQEHQRESADAMKGLTSAIGEFLLGKSSAAVARPTPKG